jgi:hypothetical protein
MPEEQDMPKQPLNEELTANAIVQDSSISSSETKIPDMEVHHHPDLHHKRKNFREYFLEFLMIFLAVTMGFFAESLRENIARHEKEKQLMVMMVEDLKTDIQKLDSSILKNNVKIASLDTLRRMIYQSKDKPLPDTDARKMYYIFRFYGSNIIPFAPTQRTLDQFDRNDGFNIIRKQKISDSIVSYQEYDNRLNNQLKVFDENYQWEAFTMGQTLFNAELLETFLYRDSAAAFLQSTGSFSLLTYDKHTLLIFGGKLLASRGVLYNYVRQMRTQKEKAERLISLITKEYHLKDE